MRRDKHGNDRHAGHESTARRLSRASLRVTLLAFLVLSSLMVRSLEPVAQAEDISASDVCWLNPASGVDACPRGYAPPDLLGRDAYAAMTAQESAALHRLETQALDTVLDAHGLPEGDRDAVATWARSDAQAALFEIVVQAMGTDAGTRTPDQQQAVDWVGDMFRTVKERVASRSAAEYAKWAGLDMHRYWQLIDARASEQDLKDFLSQRPQPYNVPDINNATGGWCKYTPPSGYHDSDYTARDVQSCYQPCTDQYLCEPEPPTYTDFKSWGQGEALSESLGRVNGSSTGFKIALSLSSSVTFAAGLVSLKAGGGAITKAAALYEKVAADAADAARASAEAAQAAAEAAEAADAAVNGADAALNAASQASADAAAAAKAASQRAASLAATLAKQSYAFKVSLQATADIKGAMEKVQAAYFEKFSAIESHAVDPKTGESAREVAFRGFRTTGDDLITKLLEQDAYTKKLAQGLAKIQEDSNAASTENTAAAAAAKVARAAEEAVAEAAAKAAAATKVADVAGKLGKGAEVVMAASEVVMAAAGAIAAVVGTVITAVEESARLADIAALPGNLAALVAQTRAPAGDVTAMLDRADSGLMLFDLFVNATLPGVRTDATCDDDDPQLIGQCLNQTEVPPARATDPHFVISGPSGDATVSSVLVQKGAGDVPSRTVRISGRWFVTQPQGSASSAATQGLQMYYNDWNGSLQAVTLADYPGKGLVFVNYDLSSAQTSDPQTCVAEGTCWVSRTIFFQDLDGSRRQARIEEYAAPTGTPSYGPAQPVETKPVSFEANGFAPAHAVGPIHYGWEFQKAGCGGMPCTTVTTTDGTPTSRPSYGERLGGASTSFSWETSGTYAVRLTATDSQGRVALTTIPVEVAEIPAAVSVDEHDTPAASDSPYVLHGELGHAGLLDNFDVTVTWGDGTNDQSSYGPHVVTLQGSPVRFTAESGTTVALSATHTYRTPGTYRGSVSATSATGQTTRVTFTQIVE
jgi:hypothetical protein